MASMQPMELIIKPTEACNFKCTFCSSTQISDEHTMVLDLNKIFDFLTHYKNTNTIIINGGDPLMVKPSYYWEIIKFLDDNEMDTTLSFTTNLWAFYKKPEMWVELFKHRRVGVTTSFNYGDTRRITKDRVFTINDFWKVSDLFSRLVGYRPDFISVITDDNLDTAIANVKLAQEMGVECKLNHAMASGDQSDPLQLSKIYKIYVQIYDMGLATWEYNTKQMMRRLSSGDTTCPQTRNCDSHIRALNPGGDIYSCGQFGDDREYPVNFVKEKQLNVVETPLKDQADLHSLKQDCLTCPMFEICNGCHKTIKDMKNAGIVEQHCKEMKTLAPKILEITNQCFH